MTPRTVQLSVAGGVALAAVATAQLMLNGWIAVPLIEAALTWTLVLVIASLYVASSADWDRTRAFERGRWVVLGSGLVGVILLFRSGLPAGLMGVSLVWPSMPQVVFRGPLLIGATLIQLGVLASLAPNPARGPLDHVKKLVELGLILALAGVLAIGVFN